MDSEKINKALEECRAQIARNQETLNRTSQLLEQIQIEVDLSRKLKTKAMGA